MESFVGEPIVNLPEIATKDNGRMT
jgi:hypothetical protein